MVARRWAAARRRALVPICGRRAPASTPMIDDGADREREARACAGWLLRGRRRPGRRGRPSWRTMPYPYGPTSASRAPRPACSDRARARRTELLVGRGDRGRRRPALDEAPARRPHGRRARPGRRAGGATALVNASGSSGGTARPAPARSTVRATSVPGSTLATMGRPAARIEYSFDGTLDQARPRLSGTTWTSAGGQHLGQPGLGLHVDEAHVVEAPRPAARGRAGPHPPPLITNTTSGSSAQATAASSTRSSDWEKPDVAGVHHDPLAGEAELGAGRRSPSGRADPVGVDEVRDDPHLGGLRSAAGSAARRSWPRTLSARSSDSTVTASARR